MDVAKLKNTSMRRICIFHVVSQPWLDSSLPLCGGGQRLAAPGPKWLWVGWPEDWLADYCECQMGAGGGLPDACGEVWQAYQAAGFPSIRDNTPLGSM